MVILIEHPVVNHDLVILGPWTTPTYIGPFQCKEEAKKYLSGLGAVPTNARWALDMSSRPSTWNEDIPDANLQENPIYLTPGYTDDQMKKVLLANKTYCVLVPQAESPLRDRDNEEVVPGLWHLLEVGSYRLVDEASLSQMVGDADLWDEFPKLERRAFEIVALQGVE